MVLPTTRQRHPSFNQGIFLRICHLSSDSTWLRPAGISTSSPGIIDWAGGMINWKDPDYQSADVTVDSLMMTSVLNMLLGHCYALLKSVVVLCADPVPLDPKNTSYVYGANSSALTPIVTFSNLSIPSTELQRVAFLLARWLAHYPSSSLGFSSSTMLFFPAFA